MSEKISADLELSACPFCGGRAKLAYATGRRGGMPTGIRCENIVGCGAQVDGPPHRWNSRLGPVAPAQIDNSAIRAQVVLGQDDPYGDRAWFHRQRGARLPR